MKTSPATRCFLVDLIKGLELVGCDPILLRNYESFPDEIGNDLDVFVTKKSLPLAFSTLQECAEKQGGNIAHLHRRGYFIAVWLRFPDCAIPVHIDLYHGALTWHGLHFLNDCELIANAETVIGGIHYKIPTPAHEAIVSCLASILWGGFFKSRYQQHLVSLLARSSQFESFTSILARQFGNPGRVLATDVFEGRAADVVNPSYARRLHFRLMARSLLSQPLRSICAWLNHWSEEAACYFFRLPGVGIQYDRGQWDDAELQRLRNILGHYFGGTHEIVLRKWSFFQAFKNRRLRGKNHLILIHGSRFRINGRQIRLAKEDASLNADALAEIVLSGLVDRTAMQYQPE